ncbi:hypothetical protein LA080_009189 [Diaporthe eres]|uniref:Uncharacterized protein n=1 Tax=Diaporthe vaccinii TaxID=105482 RepID=A0ABR4FAM3_9PEZI|nr:hypothetical protein LA080_009189 [Diaporthe eres]
MPKHSRAASSLSSLDAEDNQIERIAGVHLDGNQYYRLGWDIQHFSSQEINPIILKMFLEGRFRRDGYGLSLIGHAMYQLWSPESLTQIDIDSCKDASRDVDNMYRVISFGDSKQNQH